MDHLKNSIYKYLTPSNIYIVQLNEYHYPAKILKIFSNHQLAQEYVNQVICQEIFNNLERFLQYQSDGGCLDYISVQRDFWIYLIDKCNLQINECKITNPLTLELITKIIYEYHQYKKSIADRSEVHFFYPLEGKRYSITCEPLNYN